MNDMFEVRAEARDFASPWSEWCHRIRLAAEWSGTAWKRHHPKPTKHCSIYIYIIYTMCICDLIRQHSGFWKDWPIPCSRNWQSNFWLQIKSRVWNLEAPCYTRSMWRMRCQTSQGSGQRVEQNPHKVLPPYKHLNLIAKTFQLITSLLSNVKPSPRTISFHLVLLRYLFAVLLHMEYLEFDSRYRTVPRPPYRPRDRPMAIRPLIGHIVQLQDLLLGDHLSQWHGKCWKTMGKSETESPNCEIGASICHLSIMFPSFPHGKHR